MTHILILGGGIGGLAAAWYLASSNVKVTVLEASDQLGGLGTFFESEGRFVDRFYHSITASDTELLALIEDLGLKDQLYWKPTGMGMVVDGRRYPFNTAADLLRFSPLTLPERLRLGAMTLLLRPLGRRRDLDSITVEEWLRPLMGDGVWETVWSPLFRVKFGPRAGRLPALYIWSRMGRESNAARRAYIRGGLKHVLDTLAEQILARGGTIHLSCPAISLRERASGIDVEVARGDTLHADWVYSTIPLPLLSRMVAGSSLEGQFLDPGLPYMGVVCIPFFLSRPLDGFYWSAVLGTNSGFDGVIEASALIDRDLYAGRHLAYAMKYCESTSDTFSRSDETLLQEWSADLLELYSDLDLKLDEVLEARVFRAPHVEPAYPVGYSKMMPAYHARSAPLILATSAQAYPGITSWNSTLCVMRQALATLNKALPPV